MKKEDLEEQPPRGSRKIPDGRIVQDVNQLLSDNSQREINDELKRHPLLGARQGYPSEASLPRRHSEPSHTKGHGMAIYTDRNYRGTDTPKFSRRPKS